jgi:uncharacterized membrane protein
LGEKLTGFYIFVIRAMLGLMFAIFLVRFFYGEIAPVYVAGLAIFLVGLAYVLEYWRKKKELEAKKGEHRD